MGQKKTYFKSALKIKIGQKNPYLKKQLVSSSFSLTNEWQPSTEANEILDMTDITKDFYKTKLKEFIQHYEKLTRWMMKIMPAKADILIKIDSNQIIKKIVI